MFSNVFFFRRVAIWNDHRCGDDALEERGKVTFVDNTDLTLGLNIENHN